MIHLFIFWPHTSTQFCVCECACVRVCVRPYSEIYTYSMFERNPIFFPSHIHNSTRMEHDNEYFIIIQKLHILSGNTLQSIIPSSHASNTPATSISTWHDGSYCYLSSLSDFLRPSFKPSHCICIAQYITVTVSKGFTGHSVQHSPTSTLSPLLPVTSGLQWVP